MPRIVKTWFEPSFATVGAALKLIFEFDHLKLVGYRRKLCVSAVSNETEEFSVFVKAYILNMTVSIGWIILVCHEVVTGELDLDLSPAVGGQSRHYCEDEEYANFALARQELRC